MHWTHVSADSRIFGRGWYFCSLTVDPKNAERLYVMNTIVLRSDDGGKHFIALKGDPTGDDFHALWIDPTDSDRQILGVDQGALITLDGGNDLEQLVQPADRADLSRQHGQSLSVLGLRRPAGLRCGGPAEPHRERRRHHHAAVSRDHRGRRKRHDRAGPGPTRTSSTVARVDKLDTRTGQTRDVDPTLAYPEIHHRGAWTLPLAFSRRGKRALYFADQRLFRTPDGGDHWTPISPDLTRPDAGIPANLDAPTAADDDHVGKRRGVIYTIAPSPLSADSALGRNR